MKSWILICAASLLLVEAHALFPEEFSSSSPRFHRRGLSKLRDTSGFRLPGTATPNSYNLSLDLKVNSETDASLSGKLIINLDVLADNDSNDLTLNSYIDFNNETDSFTWSYADGDQACSLASSGTGYVTIKCPDSIIGTNQTLTIDYTPTLTSDTMDGAYLAKYKENGEEKLIIATQFEEDSARKLFPCFDEPAYKATFSLTLSTSGTVNLSNWIANTDPIETTADSTTFAETPRMSAYLLAFLATQDFQSVPAELDDKNYTLEVFVRAGAVDYVSLALTAGPLLIDEMGTFTGITYEKLGNSKMSLAAIPEFAAGGMENWGLINIREVLFIDEADRTANIDKQRIVEVIAHELAHQWFGDYVTMNWWSDTWLNEGFAQYFEYYLTGQLESNSDYEMLNQLVVQTQQLALKADATPASIPLSNNASDVTTDDDLSSEFGDISYSKGACIVKMLRYALGDDLFQNGLNVYLNNHGHSNATSDNLLTALQSVAGDDLAVKTLFEEWIYAAGYPILNVTLNDANNVTISAAKFSASLNKTGENATANWWIPLTYTTSEDANFTVDFQWKAPADLAEVQIPIQTDSWILLNVQSAAFYRVNYDQTLLDRLISVLNNSETMGNIHVLNRAQLLDDAFNIARSQDESDQAISSYLNAFKLAGYLQFETEYHPWYTFFTEMQYLLIRIQDEDTLSGLKEKILDVIESQLNITTLTSVEAHTQVLRSNLILTWACKLKAEACIEWAVKEFENYQTNKTSINNNFRDTMICTVLSNANTSQEAFSTVYEIVTTSNLPQELKDLALSFSCLSNGTLINQLLQATLNTTEPPFPRNLYDIMLTRFIRDPSKISYVLDFALNYDEEISKAWNKIEGPDTILLTQASAIYSTDYNDLINAYITEYKDNQNRSVMVETATASLDLIASNIKWVDKYGDVLKTVIV